MLAGRGDGRPARAGPCRAGRRPSAGDGRPAPAAGV